MAIEVGSAFVSIVPSFRGLASAIQSGIGTEAVKAGQQVGQQLGSGVENEARKAGGRAKDGILSHFKGLGGTLIAAAGIGAGFSLFTSLIADARESAKVASITENAIRSTGGAAHVTANQVSELATAISNKTGADDEAVQSGQNLLLTFTGIQNRAGANNDIFNQASQSLVDMTAAMNNGNVSSDTMKATAIQLGKALNDPVAGISALSRVGVTFNDQQKQQIALMTKAGDTAGAQRVVLAELNKEFGGTAAAATNPMQRLGVIFGNLREQLGTYLLPYIDRFAGFMSDRLIPAVSGFTTQYGPAIGRVFTDIGTGIRDTVGFVASNADWLLPLAAGIGAIVVAVSAWTAVSRTAMAVQTAWRTVQAFWAVATGAATAAEVGLTSAIWANTAAMLSNPIGLIIIGLIALGAALFIAWQKSETFRSIVMGALHAIGDAAMWLWNSVLLPTWTALQAAWGFVASAFAAVWTGVLQPVFTAVGAVATWLWVNVFSPALAGIAAAWSFVATAVSAVWDGLLKPVLTAVGAIAWWLWDTIFKVALFAIRAEWAGLSVIFAAVWNGVLKPIFSAVGAVVGWLWTTVFVPALAGIRIEWAYLSAALAAVWNTVLHPMFSFAGSVVMGLWNGFVKPAFDGIRSAWSALVTGVKLLWDSTLHPLFKTIGDTVSAAGRLVGSAFDGIGGAFSRAWDGAKKAVVGGWNLIAGWVNDHVIAKVNDLFHIGIKPIPTFATGGPVTTPSGTPAYAGGGAVSGPGTSTSDSILARLSDGEFVLQASAVRQIGLDKLNALNQAGRINFVGPGGDPSGMTVAIPGFAAGGNVSATKDFIRAQAGKPYVMGATGPDAWDCSGLVGAVWAMLNGKNPYARYFSTVNEAGFFQPGLAGAEAYNVGYFGGGGASGHTAGMLDGLKFEATPPRVLVGATNYSPWSGLFTSKGHLDVGTKTLWGWLVDHTVGEVRAWIANAINGVTGAIPKMGMFGDMLGGLVRNAVNTIGFDEGGWLAPGLNLTRNATGQPEPVLSPQQWRTLNVATGRRDARPPINIHVHPREDQSETEVAQAVSRELAWMLR